jgi:uncharacterized protein
MTSIPVLAGAGAVIGVLYGLFGVGSAFATPLLALLGVPALAAVASPLPSLLPGSAAGATTYARAGLVDRAVAVRTLRGAVPACILGALASHWLGGPWLLALSGAVLVLVGVRIVVPMKPVTELATVTRRERLVLVTALGVLVGFAAGLLSNGGGFLLVPLFLLALGLTLPEATATSLVVATVLTVPTVVTHAMLGDIDWAVAIPFTLGLVPAAVLGARWAPRLPVARLQATFGVLLVAVGGWFLYRQARVLGLG